MPCCRAFFAADDGVHGRELWSTDGTTAGTVLARDLRPGAASSNPRDLAAMGSRLFLLADGGASDALWAMDSSGQITRVRLLGNGRRASSLVAAGTRLLADLALGLSASGPNGFSVAGDLVAFDADDGVHGREVWGVHKKDL